jgi:DNA modification methylase
VTPYYAHAGITIYHGDCRTILPQLDPAAFACLICDPPYGAGYQSNQRRRPGNARGSANDQNTAVRDAILAWWGPDRPALVFGTWRAPRPASTRGVLIWDKGSALGTGDLTLPWKLNHEELYVCGRGFVGRRTSGSVLAYPPVQSVGRQHPHEKPVGLMIRLLRARPPGPVLDPTCGSGSLLRAAKELGRPAVGIEVVRRICQRAARRCAQEVLPLPEAAS